MSNKFDKAVEVGSNLDWITPAWAMLNSLFHNGLGGIFMPLWSVSALVIDKGELKRLLRDNGITAWGFQLIGTDWAFSILKADIQKTWVVLRAAHVSIGEAPEPFKGESPGQQSPAPGINRPRSNLFDSIFGGQ